MLDAFTSGGAQRRGGSRAVDFEAATDLDYVRGVHSMRAGVLLEGGRYRSDDAANYFGTYTFASLRDYEAGRPSNFTRRTGLPDVEYGNLQAGAVLAGRLALSQVDAALATACVTKRRRSCRTGTTSRRAPR